MKVFVVAMENEADCLLRHLAKKREEILFGRRVIHGELNGEEIVVYLSGIGKANAAATTQLALQTTKTKQILNFGLCGGLDTDMKIGDVFSVTDAVQYDFDLSQVNHTSCGTLDERESPFIPCVASTRVRARRLATGDRFTDKVDDVEFLRGLGAGLRDMEGAAIAQICERAQATCTLYKCVCDLIWLGDATGEYKKNLAICLEALSDFAKNF